jgi:hypothetical protein
MKIKPLRNTFLNKRPSLGFGRKGVSKILNVE